jgi:hypothetical protein
VLLPAEGLVAKVSTSTLPGRGGEALTRELDLGRRLAERGAPIAVPADDPGPHQHDGATLTLWRHHATLPKPPGGGRLLGEALRSVQAGLSGTPLPRLADRVAAAVELFPEAGDRQIAQRVQSGVAGLLTADVALHGEPHDGNVLWTADGPRLIDLEATCLGPLEWDLAYLPEEARQAFPERRDDVVAALRPVVSLCVAAWCLVQPGRAPAVDEAARFHLAVLRRS